jgi:clan AA aspartic protease
MITGRVNAELEAIIQLEVAGSGSRQRQVDAVIDTGFTGYLTSPHSVIAALQLAWLGREEGTLADGSVDLFDVYRATLVWDGHPKPIEVEAAHAAPLVGMALLERHSLQIDVVNGGIVTINVLP